MLSCKIVIEEVFYLPCKQLSFTYYDVITMMSHTLYYMSLLIMKKSNGGKFVPVARLNLACVSMEWLILHPSWTHYCQCHIASYKTESSKGRVVANAIQMRHKVKLHGHITGIINSHFHQQTWLFFLNDHKHIEVKPNGHHFADNISFSYVKMKCILIVLNHKKVYIKNSEKGY